MAIYFPATMEIFIFSIFIKIDTLIINIYLVDSFTFKDFQWLFTIRSKSALFP